MQKLNLDLPKYRLQLHLKLIKRRKPLVVEPILPTKSLVNRKYRKGTFGGKLVRYFADHKAIRGVLASGFVITTTLIAFTPQSINVKAEGSTNTVIESQVDLITQKSMQYPVETVRINQGYSLFHHAIDFGGGIGVPVRATMTGVVSYAGWDNSGYGNLVVLEHQSGFESYYAHLSKIEVKTGQEVSQDTEIGKMGETGNATGPHLHFEIHQNGIPLNPLTVLSH